MVSSVLRVTPLPTVGSVEVRRFASRVRRQWRCYMTAVVERPATERRLGVSMEELIHGPSPPWVCRTDLPGEDVGPARRGRPRRRAASRRGLRDRGRPRWRHGAAPTILRDNISVPLMAAVARARRRRQSAAWACGPATPTPARSGSGHWRTGARTKADPSVRGRSRTAGCAARGTAMTPACATPRSDGAGPYLLHIVQDPELV